MGSERATQRVVKDSESEHEISLLNTSFQPRRKTYESNSSESESEVSEHDEIQVQVDKQLQGELLIHAIQARKTAKAKRRLLARGRGEDKAYATTLQDGRMRKKTTRKLLLSPRKDLMKTPQRQVKSNDISPKKTRSMSNTLQKLARKRKELEKSRTEWNSKEH